MSEKYNIFLKLFTQANCDLTKQDQYRKAQEEWKEIKKDPTKLEFKKAELNAKIAFKKESFLKMWQLQEQVEKKPNPPCSSVAIATPVVNEGKFKIL
jgi:hypothetical protein